MKIKSIQNHFIMDPKTGSVSCGSSNDRPFSEETNQYFRRKSGQAICHRIPFQTMKEVLANAFSQPDPETILYNLRDLVMIRKAWDPSLCRIVCDPSSVDLELTNEMIQDISAARGNDPQQFLDLLENFLMVLNNAYANLRIGSANWNKSIGNAFDPEAYKVYPEYFLLSEVDGFILQVLENDFIPTIPGKEISIYTGNNLKGEAFIYSSSNSDEKFIHIQEMNPWDRPILYPEFNLTTGYPSGSKRIFSKNISKQ